MSSVLSAIDGTEPTADKITIQYENGHSVDFPARDTGLRVKRLVKESYKDEKGLIHTVLYFRDGQFVDFIIPKVGIEGENFSLLEKLAMYGAEQKLGDNLSSYGDETIDSMVWDTRKLIDRLTTGKWVAEREGGPSGESVLFKALMAYKADQLGDDFEEASQEVEIKQFLAGLSQNEKNALKTGASPLKPYLDELRNPPRDVSHLLAKI